MEQELSMARMCAIPIAVQHILRCRVLTFREDADVPTELVHTKEPPTSTRPETTMGYVRRTASKMLYADDDCIVCDSRGGLLR